MRGFTLEDIINAAKTVDQVTWQDTHESYLIRGLDIYGAIIFIVADIIDQVVIITIFPEDEL